MKRSSLLIVLITIVSGLLTISPLSAQPVPAAFQRYVPEIAEQQFVYLVPAPGFRPHALGMSGITALETALRTNAFPFYVILGNRLPGSTPDPSEDGRALLTTIEGAWRRTAPLHLPDTASSLFISLNPVVVTLRVGSRWSGRYHLQESFFATELDLLRQQVTEGNPAQRDTIIELARRVEREAITRSDPERQQAQARALENATREHARAQELPNLRDEVDQSLDLLLNPGVRHLGQNQGWFRERIQHARAMMERGDPDLMRVATHELRYDRRLLIDLLRAREANVEHEFERIKNRVIMGLLLLILAAALFAQRENQVRLLKRAISKELALAQSTLEHLFASGKREFHEARSRIVALAQTEGVSKTQYLQVAREIDEIYARCFALSARVRLLRNAVQEGSFWQKGVLEETFELLGTSIHYTLSSEDQAKLFEPHSYTVEVPFQDIRYDIEQRIEHAKSAWKKLLEISCLQDKAPEQAFSDAVLEELHELVLREELDPKWLQDHPLLRGEDSGGLYQELDALRLRNPVGYHERVSLLTIEEDTMSEALKRLIALRQRVREATIHEISVPEGTIASTRDHPATTLKKANDARDEFDARFKARRPLAELTTAAEEAIALYTRTSMQVQALARAVEQTGAVLQSCSEQQQRAKQLRSTALQQCISVKAYNRDLDTRTPLSECDRDLERAHELAATAQRLLNAKRHLEAFQEATRATQYLSHAEQGFTDLIELCRKGSLRT